MESLGTSRGTPFTMIHPRLFHRFSFFSHPGLVYGIFSANGLPREYHGQYTPLAFKNIKSVKSNIIGRNVERMKKIEWLYIRVVVWLVILLVVLLVVCNARLTQMLLWPLEMSKSSHLSLGRRHILDISGAYLGYIFVSL